MRRAIAISMTFLMIAMSLASVIPVSGDTGSRDVTDLIEVSQGLPNTGDYTTTFFIDINSDTTLDLVAGSYSSNLGLKAFKNNGNSWAEASSGLPNTGSYGLGAVADIDNDNDMDLIVPYENEYSGGGLNGIEVWLSSGGVGGISWTHGVDPINTSSFDGVAADDVDGDNDVDIAGSVQMNGGLKFWFGNGGTGWTESSTGLPSTGIFHGLVFADMNEDSYLDIVVGTNSGVALFTNDGDGTWTDNSTGLPNVAQTWNVRVADMDNDDNLDIIAATDQGANVLTSNGGAGGTFSWTDESTGLLSTPMYEAIDVGKVDLDDNLDILAADDATNNGVDLYFGDGGAGGSLSFTETTTNKLPTTSQYYSVDLGDFNNDGKDDIVIGSGANTGIRVWRTRAVLSERPQADAGSNQDVWIDTLVQLDGSGSTDDTAIVEYDWNISSQPSGSTAVLSDETIVNPTFTPEVAGDYIITLQVKDEHDQWAQPEASVTIKGRIFPNALPVADAGGDQTVKIFTLVHLDGANSTDDAGIIAHEWNVTTEPEDSSIELSDDSTVDPTFMPEYVGQYRITLTVKDVNNTWALEDQVVITVQPEGEYKPLANAGPPLEVELGDPVTLNGTGSTDDIEVVFWDWTLVDQPFSSNLNVEDIAQPTLNPGLLGVYNLELRVKDSDNLWSEKDYTHFKVIPKDLEPEAVISKPLDGEEYLTIDQITFDGSDSSDPEGGKLTYSWESSIDGLLGIEETFSRNLTKGSHTIALTVTDDHDHAVTTTISITVTEDQYPIAAMTVNATLVQVAWLVSFDGIGSTDTEGVVFEYFFDFGDGKDSDWVKTPKVTHTYTQPGDYGATLKAKDSLDQVSETTEELWIKVGLRPKADLKSNVVKVTQKKDIELDASGSTDDDGDIVDYWFDFGDKTNSGWVTTEKIKHRFDKPGRYTMTVRVRDDDGFESKVAKMTITVSKKASQDVGMDMTLPIILAVVIIAVTVLVLIMLKKRTDAKVVEEQKKAQEAARPKEDFTEVDSLMAQQQQPYDQTQQYQGYDQTGYDQQQYQQGYDQQGHDQTQQQYPPPQDPNQGQQY